MQPRFRWGNGNINGCRWSPGTGQRNPAPKDADAKSRQPNHAGQFVGCPCSEPSALNLGLGLAQVGQQKS